MSPDASRPLVVRYDEIALKGKNRIVFERILMANLEAAVEGSKARRIWGRILLEPSSERDRAASRAAQVFGVRSVSPAQRVEGEIRTIGRAALEEAGKALQRFPGDGPVPFRVDATRADKSFRLNSMDINRRVGGRLLEAYPRLKVHLDAPELTVGVDLRTDAAYVYADRIPGPGGLPVGCQGSVVSLISGGIDSPVASWMAMRRGARVHFLTFHSAPFLGEASRDKVVDLVRLLSRFQPETRLWVCPFGEIQTLIRDHCPPSWRTVLYRRLMQRVAHRLCEREGSLAIVTGESVGQVASQTLENMATIEAAAPTMTLRPLVGMDKSEVIERAKTIGTFDTSTQPLPDCCTLFQPSRPVLRGDPGRAERAESRLPRDAEALATAALEAAETFDFS